MIIYNVTVKVEESIVEEWTEWMQSKHIPDVLETGLFVEHKFCKLLGGMNDEDTDITFVIQYSLNSMKDFHQYHAKHAKALQNEHQTRFKDKYVAFRTFMEQIN